MGFSMSELLILMLIGVILFGPEDLPDIARTVGKFVYEIKKMINEASKDIKDVVNTPTNVINDATQDLKEIINTPANVMNKVVEESIKPALDMNSTSSQKPTHEDQASHEPKEELLSYDEVEKSSSNPRSEDNDKVQDPLAELPADMVSYKVENKGASR